MGGMLFLAKPRVYLGMLNEMSVWWNREFLWPQTTPQKPVHAGWEDTFLEVRPNFWHGAKRRAEIFLLCKIVQKCYFMHSFWERNWRKNSGAKRQMSSCGVELKFEAFFFPGGLLPA